MWIYGRSVACENNAHCFYLTDIADDELKFGDEIECGVFVVDDSAKTVKLSVRSAELLHYLEGKEAEVSHQSEGCTWHPGKTVQKVEYV
jgi:predicted RNA-binding protein with RPS1 domain